MKYLIDSHIGIWMITQPHLINSSVKDILLDVNNEIFISTVSFWEINLKYSIGKLNLKGVTPELFKSELEDACQISILDLTIDNILSYYKLSSFHHKDPFDRMLVWQAIQNKLGFITDDVQIHMNKDCGLKVVW